MQNYRESIDFKMDKVDLGIAINRLREYRGLTIRDLSAASGVSHSKLSNIENGQLSPTYYTISRVFRALGHSVASGFNTIEATYRDLDGED